MATTTDLGNNVFIDFEPDEFTLPGWDKYRKIHAPVRGMHAQTDTRASGPTFEVDLAGSDIVVTRVQGSIALNRAGCWVVTGRETSDLLEHEQGHYYITYITYVLALQQVRNLTVPVSRARIPPGANAHVRKHHMHNAMAREINTVLAQTQPVMSGLTTDYDAAHPPGTNHSNNRPEQQRWNQRFAASLANGTAL